MSTAHAPTPAAPIEVRLDKWLWCVRVYKTRAQATEACRGGKVTVDGQHARPAREVRTGQTVTINLGGWTRTLRIGQVLDHRVAHAELAPYLEDITAPEERERGRERQVQNLLARPHGEGRPTKRERRAIDQAFRGPYDY
jgi:ribosome-associated heat shock protein Hsp15